MSDTRRRQELAHFLRTRREQLSPEAAGVSRGSRRRTPGLRREELSQLAGVGLTWYTRLEQGQDITVSLQVVESLARVFHLNVDERHHLFVLAREQVPVDPYPLTSTITPQLQRVLDSISHPAYVINPRWDIVGWNRAMYQGFPNSDQLSRDERNILRSLFLSPVLRTMLNDWEEEAKKVLALFRASSEQYIKEAWFKALITELEQRSQEFRTWWARHDIQAACTGPKELNHPLVGKLAFEPGVFQVVDAPDLQMVIFTAAEAETARKLLQLAEPGGFRSLAHRKIVI